MDRKLKLNPDFKFCTVKDGENIYTPSFCNFNVSRLSQYIDTHQDMFPLIEIDTDSWLDGSFVDEEDYDKKDIERADLDRPVIIGELSPDKFESGFHPARTDYFNQGYTLFEGQQKLIKANHQGVKTLKAYVVHMEQHLPFIADKESYERYIGYWNEKIDSYGNWFKNNNDGKMDYSKLDTFRESNFKDESED